MAKPKLSKDAAYCLNAIASFVNDHPDNLFQLGYLNAMAFKLDDALGHSKSEEWTRGFEAALEDIKRKA